MYELDKKLQTFTHFSEQFMVSVLSVDVLWYWYHTVLLVDMHYAGW